MAPSSPQKELGAFLLAFSVLSANISRMTITVVWPSVIPGRANVWRILDLAGMTATHRQSRDVTRGGIVYLDGNNVGLRDTISTGTTFLLEIRYPNRPHVRRNIFLANSPPRGRPRG